MAIEAVVEVGNPTLLATLAVIAAILPMVCRRIDGSVHARDPYWSQAAMAFSVVVAFLVTPGAAIRILKQHGSEHHAAQEDSFTRVYRRIMKVKMLPLDNKSEFQVIVDMPNGITWSKRNVSPRLWLPKLQSNQTVRDDPDSRK